MKAVAIKKDQTREWTPAFKAMGTRRCGGYGEEFIVFHDPAFVDKAVAERQAHWLEKVLAEEHEREQKHPDRIQLSDWGNRMEPDVRNRLRRVARSQTTRLTHSGRKTGKPHEVTIWFVLDGEKFYIGTANVKRQWVQNVQKTPQVRLSIGGENFAGTARFLSDSSEHERAMAAIRRKYWIFRPIIELGRMLTAVGFMRDSTGTFEVTLVA